MEGGEDATAAFDADFGAGFTKALVAFIEILQAEFQVTGLALQSCFGLDVREYSQLGYIDFNFLVLDGEVVCIRPEPQANEPAWTILRSQGIDTVYHLPSLQVALQGHFI